MVINYGAAARHPKPLHPWNVNYYAKFEENWYKMLKIESVNEVLFKTDRHSNTNFEWHVKYVIRSN